MITNERLDKICREQYRAVFRYCILQLGSKKDAEDITRETFLLMQQENAALEEDGIRAWLYEAAQQFINRKKSEAEKELAGKNLAERGEQDG